MINITLLNLELETVQNKAKTNPILRISFCSFMHINLILRWTLFLLIFILVLSKMKIEFSWWKIMSQ